MKRHVRNEILTREHYDIEANGKTLVEMDDRRGISWCGEAIQAHEWFFQDSDHVLLSLMQGSGIAPCPACLREIRTVIEKELSGAVVDRHHIEIKAPKPPPRRSADSFQLGRRVLIASGEHADCTGTIVGEPAFGHGAQEPWRKQCGYREGYVLVLIDAEAGQVANGPGAIARGGRGGQVTYLNPDILVRLP